MREPVTYPLFHPVAHRNDPQSSYRAGERVHNTGTAGTQRQEVYKALCKHGSCSSRELAEREGLDRYMVARRLPELVSAGLVTKTNIGSADTIWTAKGEAQ